MREEKLLAITAHLRQDARIKLSKLSRLTGIPVSTLFDRIHSPDSIGIKRLSALLDFQKLGFNTCATIMFKVLKEKRDQLKEHLLCSTNVNSLMRINNGYDFMAECVFRDMRELEEFCEKLEQSYGVKTKEVHFIVEELKRESFLSDPSLAGQVMGYGRA
ncbi:MAG: Lrp/AsnC family transcriptional regulator [Candidatus Woesearchaeota archaeon]